MDRTKNKKSAYFNDESCTFLEAEQKYIENNDRQHRHANITFPSLKSVLWSSEQCGDLFYLKSENVLPLFTFDDSEFEKITRLLDYNHDDSLENIYLNIVSVADGLKSKKLEQRIPNSFSGNHFMFSLNDHNSPVRQADNLCRLTVPVKSTQKSDSSLCFNSQSTINLASDLNKSLHNGKTFSLKSIYRVRAIGHAQYDRGSRREQAVKYATFRMEIVLPNVSFCAIPIRQIPMLRTPLSIQLMNDAQSSASPDKMGYLTLDSTRKLVPLMESDATPTTHTVGVWVHFNSSQGVEHPSCLINHPLCWGACVRYLCSDYLHERRFSDIDQEISNYEPTLVRNETFLLVVICGPNIMTWEITRKAKFPTSHPRHSLQLNPEDFMCADFTVKLALRDDGSNQLHLCQFRPMSSMSSPLGNRQRVITTSSVDYQTPERKYRDGGKDNERDRHTRVERYQDIKYSKDIGTPSTVNLSRSRTFLEQQRADVLRMSYSSSSGNSNTGHHSRHNGNGNDYVGEYSQSSLGACSSLTMELPTPAPRDFCPTPYSDDQQRYAPVNGNGNECYQSRDNVNVRTSRQDSEVQQQQQQQQKSQLEQLKMEVNRLKSIIESISNGTYASATADDDVEPVSIKSSDAVRNSMTKEVSKYSVHPMHPTQTVQAAMMSQNSAYMSEVVDLRERRSRSRSVEVVTESVDSSNCSTAETDGADYMQTSHKRFGHPHIVHQAPIDKFHVAAHHQVVHVVDRVSRDVNENRPAAEYVTVRVNSPRPEQVSVTSAHSQGQYETREALSSECDDYDDEEQSCISVTQQNEGQNEVLGDDIQSRYSNYCYESEFGHCDIEVEDGSVRDSCSSVQSNFRYQDYSDVDEVEEHYNVPTTMHSSKLGSNSRTQYFVTENQSQYSNRAASTNTFLSQMKHTQHGGIGSSVGRSFNSNNNASKSMTIRETESVADLMSRYG